MAVLKQGSQNRHVSPTLMNEESSRSHSVYTMTIESKCPKDGVLKITTSKFHFVDLAGSERQKQTCSTGDRLKEAGNINKSLLVLGSVINSLSEDKKSHIRYRESKLTFLLKDSLGGNSKTTMVTNISPASSCFGETLSALKFAQRAKMIKNRASINQESTGSIDNLRKEITRLKDELVSSKTIISTLENAERSRMKGDKLGGPNGNKCLGNGKISLRKEDGGKADIESYKNII